MIDKRTATERGMKALMQARRDKETAVSRKQREDADKRIAHWQGILNKVQHMKEEVSFSSFLKNLNEVSKKTMSSYIDKAKPEANNHSAEYEKRRKKILKTKGNLHTPDKKLQYHGRKMYNRTKGVNTAFDKLS